MSARRRLAIAILAATVAGTLAPAAAARPRAPAARLEGTFLLSGRVTVAVHVKGEHRGQPVTRVWSFTPLCPMGACGRVSLVRQRAGGTDTLTLRRVAPGYYRGQSRFAAPLGCAGQTYPAGQTVRFTITVRITAAASSAGSRIATRIKATYTNRVRVNNTSCVFPPSRDAAVYRGGLQTTTPAAVTAATPTPVTAATPTPVTAAARAPLTASPSALSALSPAGS